ncbi:MAG: hypothetical protein ACRBBR_05950 [Cellvibrionaceae bacterium]
MTEKINSIMQTKEGSLFEFVINTDFSVSMDVNGFFVLLIFLLIGIAIWWRLTGFFLSDSFEIDEAEFGIGNHKIKLKQNNLDAQIAYQIWVELSTRKIGITIDKDVIVEVYNSWYKFFEVTRELIKEIPAKRIKREETRGIIKLSIDVLNRGVRPHLTTWQAKYRRWYAMALDESGNISKTPQQIQKEYPQYDELLKDLLEINFKLIEYRKTMYRLASGVKPTSTK